MKSYKIKCDSCCAYSINGHAVHEAASCPNDKYNWHIVDNLCVPNKNDNRYKFEDYEEIEDYETTTN